MQTLVTFPRLSTRLLLNLYGEVQKISSIEDLEKESLRRNKSIAKTANNSSDVSEFHLNDFLIDSTDYASSSRIRSSYMNFISLVNSLSSNNVGEGNQHSAKTMYRIISRTFVSGTLGHCLQRDSSLLNNAHKDANSYFGFIPRNTFNQIVDEVEILEESKAKKVQSLNNCISNAAGEFVEDIEFVVPHPTYTEKESQIYQGLLSKSNDILELDNDDNNDHGWLMLKCSSFLASSPDAGVVFSSAGQLYQEIMSMVLSTISSHSNNVDETKLQVKMFDLFGENGFEFIQTLFERIDSIVQLARSKPITAMKSESAISKHVDSSQSQSFYNHEAFITENDYENLTANQKKKLVAKEQKDLDRAIAESQKDSSSTDWLANLGFSTDYLLQERALGLQKGNISENREHWRDNLAAEGTLEYHEKKGLPAGAERKTGIGYEEVFIPAAKKMTAPVDGELVEVSQLEPWAQKAFPGTQKLNRIQSAVFKCAYNSIENMLVCAPTGAGKTNIAMLAFLRLVKTHMMVGDVIDKAALKAVYIAPMKALAQEVVAKFSERLAPLGLTVREFTGTFTFMVLLYSCC